jgi:hypothetical protein
VQQHNFCSTQGEASMSTKRLTKAFSDAIPLGPHPNPHAEWIQVRLDFIQEAIDHLEWMEKGNAEWRDMAISRAKQAETARATARVAITHLQAVLNKPRTHADQQAADTAARDWLTSIGSEPT